MFFPRPSRRGKTSDELDGYIFLYSLDKGWLYENVKVWELFFKEKKYGI
ncbi:hypothetical protein SD78_3469 [Bacillus badius]|nr:hypothetical protein SD78_3469 [Bacillus badius]